MALPHIQIGEDVLAESILASVEVRQELNTHWWCTIACRSPEDRRLGVEELLGKPLEVKTIDDDGVEHLHFSGTVHDVELEYEVWGSYTATLTAVSNSYGMDVSRHKQYYAEKTLAGIAGQIGGRHQLSIAVNAPASKALNYVQYGETDFAFLHRIVDDYGAWMRPSESGLEVFNAFQTGTALQLRGTESFKSFRLRGTRVNPSFSGAHYDHHAMQSSNFQQVSKAPEFYPVAQRLTSAVQSASAKLPPGFEPQRARAMTLDNYSEQLQAESERAMGASVVGYGESRDQTLKAGNTIAIEGALDAKGTYGLIAVNHQWTRDGYANTFRCTPWKHYRNPQPPIANTWNGIVPARVTAHNDPKKMGRIQVQFFWQEDGSTHWARTTSPHAGPDRGFMFMPEVGDEVAVAFEDGDPERPVILGSLWNGMQQAPRYNFIAEDIDENNLKRIETKSGNRIHISDVPGKESVFLATPQHTSISMTEMSDETGNHLLFLHSNGDIVLNAPNGRVHINSKLYSKKVGAPGKAEAAGAANGTVTKAFAPATAPASAPKEGFFAGLGGGLWDSTVAPLGHMIAHPIDTIEGVGHAIAHPVTTAKALGHAVVETGKGVLHGDGRSIGTAVGSVGMFFVPGADVAGGAEDVARLDLLGEAGANASKVGEASDAAKVTATGATTEAADSVSETVVLARERQAAMLKDNVAYNISPSEWDKYPTIGRNGTFVSDQAGVSEHLGDIAGKTDLRISENTASQIERGMGLEPGSLHDGFKVRQVDGISEMAPRSPLEGNKYFRGPGNHLPSGAPEMIIDSIPTVDTGAVRTILNVKVGP